MQATKTSRRRPTPPSRSANAIVAMLPDFCWQTSPEGPLETPDFMSPWKNWTSTLLASALLAALCLPAVAAPGATGNLRDAMPSVLAAGALPYRMDTGSEPMAALLAQIALPAARLQSASAPLARATGATPSLLEVDQVKTLSALDIIAMPPQPAASASQIQMSRQPAIRLQASKSLQSVRVKPSAAARAAKTMATSADCENASSGAECILPGKPAVDWRTNMGMEIDSVSGTILIPGVTLNPPPRP